MNIRKLKPYGIAVLLIGLYALELFVLSPILAIWFGLASTVIVEVLMVVTGVVVFIIFHGKLKVIFPFKKPQLSKLVGTIVIWLGTYMLTMFVATIITFFFPQEIYEAGQGVNDLVMNLSMFLGLLVVSLTPAICEEIAFRGALLSCFRGIKNKWVIIVISSLIFGAFHGSIWRLIPTAILGMGMGYLLLETENLLYNMLFHLINNAVPVILIGLMGQLYRVTGETDIGGAIESVQTMEIPISTFGPYLAYLGAVPFLFYIGRYLIHKGQPGYEGGLFPKEKKSHFIAMLVFGVAMVVAGMCLTVISLL